MDKYFVCILLCIVQILSVNGQMLVSHKEGVIVTSSSQHDPYGTWDIYHVVDSNVEIDPEICKCCGATKDETSPWFQLDLGEEYNVQRIHVIGRQNKVHSLYKMEMQLGTTEADRTVLQGVDTSDMDLRELNYTLTSPKLVRFITITLRDVKQFFVICELYVYAVCNEGTYEPDCVKTCGKCQNNAPCDGVTGVCSECINGYQSPRCQECIDGRYGSSCVGECGHCNNNDTCDKSNGFCPSGCSTGYQGNTCTQDCSFGTYGLNCSDTCGECKSNTTCNNVGGTCTACVSGYLYPLCKECIDDRYGPTCIEECGICSNNDRCDKNNGNCPHGCSAGYQGSTCKEVCSWGTYGLNCTSPCGSCGHNATCNNVYGACTACVNGYNHPKCKDCTDGRYGPTCNNECGHCTNNAVCDKSNGNCTGGCSAGYQATTCNEECEDGTYGLDCQDTCGNCFNNGPCNKMHGDCVTCAAGFTGNTCVDECQTGTYGFNCKQNCGMCLDDDVCDIYTGECPRGCTDGFKGSQCSQELNQDTSPCSPCSDNTCISIPVFIGSLFAVVVINTTSGFLWLLYRNRLHKKTHKAANNADTSIQLPNTPSNYDTLRFDNPNEESRYTELNRRS